MVKRRKTNQTLLVSDILKKSKYALNQKEIFKKLCGSIDRVTVYRILKRLIEDGLVHRIIADDGQNYFACRNTKLKQEKCIDHHIHFKCIKCRKIECIYTKISYLLPNDYIAVDSNNFILGYCGNCRQK
jgi:Fur family ferric uptake transcriptional regulator